MRHAIGGLVTATMLVAAPALADVKAGVDAWGRGDFTRAVAEWRGPAAAGDADAQFNLGQAYKLGRGVSADAAQAREWYRRAAEQGHPQAGDNYGLSLFQANERAAALPWLERSAARGEARAQFVLGTMLFNGDSVEKDWVRAYALMTRASSTGLPQASQTLAQMDNFVSLQDRQRGLAMARDLEASAGRAPRPVTLAADPGERTAPAASARGSRPAGAASVASTQAPPKAPSRPAPKAAAAAPPGDWRVQLGSFRDAGGARTLWTTLGKRVPAFASRKPFYERAGTFTRLQVGPFASNADAARACAAVRPTGNPCVPVRR